MTGFSANPQPSSVVSAYIVILGGEKPIIRGVIHIIEKKFELVTEVIREELVCLVVNGDRHLAEVQSWMAISDAVGSNVVEAAWRCY